jgi:hypothetical protein
MLKAPSKLGMIILWVWEWGWSLTKNLPSVSSASTYLKQIWLQVLGRSGIEISRLVETDLKCNFFFYQCKSQQIFKARLQASITLQALEVSLGSWKLFYQWNTVSHTRGLQTSLPIIQERKIGNFYIWKHV